MWNSEASTRFRTEAVRDHFNKSRDVKTMHDDAISTEKITCGKHYLSKMKRRKKIYLVCAMEK